MKTQPHSHTLDRNLIVAKADIPVGDVQLGPVEGSADPVFFPGGTVRNGRLQVIFDGIDSADEAAIAAATAGQTISIAVDLKDANGDVIYGALSNGVSPANGEVILPLELSFPTDILEVGTAEIVLTDPVGIDGLAVAWVCD